MILKANLSTWIIMTPLLFLLTACQQDTALVNNQNVSVGTLQFEITPNFPASVNANLNGKIYSGEWSSKKVYDETQEKIYQIQGSRSYDRYKSGQYPTYLGNAKMMAQDGSTMNCAFKYSSKLESGECTVGNETFTFSKISS